MKIKILLLLLITSLQLFAGVSGEIFTSGYHELVVNTLNALSGLAASNNEPLIKIASAIGVLIMSIKIIFNQNSRNIAGFEVLKTGAFVLAIQALFISAPDDDNHAYAVIDRISLQTTEVRQIPKGIGEFLSLFTSLEDGIMEKMELYFTTPASLSYRQAGLGFTVSTQMDIMRSNIADTNLKKTFYDYILNCKVDGDFSTGNQNLQYLLSAEGTNILTHLATDRSSLTMVYSSSAPEGEVVSCKDAWNNTIKTALNTEALNNQASIAKARGLLSQTFANDVALSNMITGSNSATVSARDQLVSAIARNATLDSVKKVATFNGVSDSMLTKQLSISEISMTNSSILANYQAQQTIPVLKALCTAFIVVISWLIGILAIATMNAGYVKFLIVLNVWLMLWSPLFQILNFGIDILVDDALSLYKNGVDANNQIGIYEILGGKLAMVTNLVWSVPILAFGIAKGGEFAMTQFISAMVSPVQNAAHHTTKTDLQSAMSENEGFTTGSGKNAHFGMANTNTSMTGVGGQTSKINSNGNNVTDIAGTDVTKVSSAVNPNVSASIDNNGNVITKNDDASATQVSGASTALTSANAKVESLQKSLTTENSNVMSQMSTAGSSNTVTNTNGDSVKIDESTGQAIQKMNSAASKEAFGSSSKDALVDSIKNDNNARTVLGVGLSVGSGKAGKNTDDKSEEDKNSILSAIAKFSPVNAAISSEGSVVLTGSNGTSFELSKNSSYGKEFSENYSKSISEQMSKSKDNTQAYANMVSAVNGESQSDANSTARKVSQAYSEQESASQTYQATKTQGTAMGDNLMNSAFQNYFSKNADRFENASKEEKADFAVNKMVEWNQSQNGIKDKMDFINDNTSKTELPNTVNTNSNIETGAKNLGLDVNSHVAGNTTYNPNSNESVRTGVENSGQEIRNSQVSNPELNSQVNNNVKEDGAVSKKVDEHSKTATQNIEANQNKNANVVHDNLMINAASGVDNGMETIKETLKNSIGGGSDDRIDPNIKRYADNNAVANESTYKNAKLGKDNLIEHGYVNDDVNKSQLVKASTEDLARIYNYDKNHDTLSSGSKTALKDELGQRGYDFNSNKYSSNYEGETIKKDSIIPNGDGGNPGSSARKLKNDFEDGFKPSF